MDGYNLTQSHQIVGINRERDWLDNTKALLSKELDKDGAVSWAAYRASQASLSSHKSAIIALLPMISENAHSLAMIPHSINVIRSALRSPVIALDQPLFALAKTIQWNLPSSHGEDTFVVMLGGLHIEMAAFKALGKWLNRSGWTYVMSRAGVADSFLIASHVTRTRCTHHVTAASVHLLQDKGYEEYIARVSVDEEAESFDGWKRELSKKFPQFLTGPEC